MKWVEPDPELLALMRPDPLLSEQELDVRPDVAKSIEQVLGKRSGRSYWVSEHDHLYALELADLGRGMPSMATVYGFWDRFEPRPPEHEITADLFEFSRWVARNSETIMESDVRRVAQHAGLHDGWPEGSLLRTPEERFDSLPEFAFEPRYTEFEGLRMAHVESGEGDPILLLHGEPTWSFLYRKMIPPLSAQGRVIAPDLIGFGRSDKPVATNAYTIKSHVRWLRRFILAHDLKRIMLVCQDWGGALGLRLLAEMPERFARLVAMNTGLATGQGHSAAFQKWRRFSQRVEELNLPKLMQLALKRPARDEILQAYGTPFPSKQYQTGALVFPRLVPIRREHPGALENFRALQKLKELDLPVLLPWADGDEVTAPAREGLKKIFRNVQGSPTVANAGHFIQEDAGEEVAQLIVDWSS